MDTDKFISVKEVERILNSSFDYITKESITISYSDLLVKTDEADLDDKDKVVIDCISNSPGIIKERLLESLQDKNGYSRRAFFRIMGKLDQHHMISVEPDKANKRIHHLFVNNQNALVLLLNDLNSFKNDYFDLIENASRLKINLTDTREKVQFTNAIIMPFRFFILVYGVFNVMLSLYNKNLDAQTRHRKFAIMSGQTDAIYSKLLEVMLAMDLIRHADEISGELVQDNSAVLDPENIGNVLKTYQKYSLSGKIEAVFDSLWKISSPIIRFADPYYCKKNPDVLKDWRKLISEYDRLPIPAKRAHYHVSKTV
jgi:hypothetical protein